jgi:chromosome segregation ATPase
MTDCETLKKYLRESDEIIEELEKKYESEKSYLSIERKKSQEYAQKISFLNQTLDETECANIRLNEKIDELQNSLKCLKDEKVNLEKEKKKNDEENKKNVLKVKQLEYENGILNMKIMEYEHQKEQEEIEDSSILIKNEETFEKPKNVSLFDEIKNVDRDIEDRFQYIETCIQKDNLTLEEKSLIRSVMCRNNIHVVVHFVTFVYLIADLFSKYF